MLFLLVIHDSYVTKSDKLFCLGSTRIKRCTSRFAMPSSTKISAKPLPLMNMLRNCFYSISNSAAFIWRKNNGRRSSTLTIAYYNLASVSWPELLIPDKCPSQFCRITLSNSKRATSGYANKPFSVDFVFHSFSVEGDNVLVSGLYADSGSAVARETAYRLFLFPDQHQEYLLSELIKCRHELATTCDFPTYAHR